MKKSVEPTSQVPQDSTAGSGRSFRQTGADGRSQSNLAQLAATINQSSRVQTQLKLAEEMQGGAVQRKRLDEKKPAQTKSKLEEKKPAQMKGKLEEKKPMQGRFEDAAGTAQLEEAAAPNRTGLPDQLKTGVESLSGTSLDDVKVHYNSGKPKQLNALAYAQGTDIHVGPGQEKHLPHEAWHIVQQKQGRVQPTMQMKVGVPVNDEPRLEREADLMGAQALQRSSGTHSDLPLEEGYGHGADCACPGCCQTRADPIRAEIGDAQGRRPAASHALSNSNTVQAVRSELVQRVCSECGKKKGHLSGCSRHKNNRGVKEKEKKEVRQESRAWNNLKHYRGSWVTDNNIVESQVKKFCKETRRTIRGHASGDNNKGEQGVTTEDLNVFKTWYTQEYGWQ